MLATREIIKNSTYFRFHGENNAEAIRSETVVFRFQSCPSEIAKSAAALLKKAAALASCKGRGELL